MAMCSLMTSDRWKAVFLNVLRSTGNFRAACSEAGVSREAAYEARLTDNDFAQAWLTSITEAVDMLEERAWRMASTPDGSGMLLWKLLTRGRDAK